jgi:transposase
MTKRGKRQVGERGKGETSSGLSVINPDAAGIDVGSKEHWVAVPADRDPQRVRRFGAFTEDLYALAEWLLQCRVRTVAMESTGVYWIPLYQILTDKGLEVKLVNARHVKHVPGRKSDVQDCQWLQQLESYGLLPSSFRPEAEICVLRSYMRQRQMLIKDGGRQLQHMEKALSQMNLKLTKVISDLSGQTGMRIVRAIVDGERDPWKLATLKHVRVKSSLRTVAKSLEGDYHAEHLFALKQAVELYDYYLKQIAECDQEILKTMQSFASRVTPGTESTPLKRKDRSRHHPLPYDGQAELYRIMGVDLTRIDGLNEGTVQLVFSELGLDLHKKWPTEAQFVSWLGLCPNNEISGGKVLRQGRRKVLNRVANALRMCAESLLNSKSALGAYARRMRAKRDSRVAITATAHKLARLIYRTIKYGQEYVDVGQAEYEKKYRAHILKSLQKRARQLGFQLIDPAEVTGLVP